MLGCIYRERSRREQDCVAIHAPFRPLPQITPAIKVHPFLIPLYGCEYLAIFSGVRRKGTAARQGHPTGLGVVEQPYQGEKVGPFLVPKGNSATRCNTKQTKKNKTRSRRRRRRFRRRWVCLRLFGWTSTRKSVHVSTASASFLPRTSPRHDTRPRTICAKLCKKKIIIKTLPRWKCIRKFAQSSASTSDQWASKHRDNLEIRLHESQAIAGVEEKTTLPYIPI